MTPSIHPKVIKKMISYYYLVYYCPPVYIDHLKTASLKMRSRLAQVQGCTPEALPELVAPEIASRITAFQQATREPEAETVKALTEKVITADRDADGTAAFQALMNLVVIHPGRSKLPNRLHRNKGCVFCTASCRYGFFTLVSEPDFNALLAMLDKENQKLAQERDAVKALWNFVKEQIWGVLEAQDGMILAEHVDKLSYCLLLLGTAKSRFALPEVQLRHYQEMSGNHVQRLQNSPLRLS